MSTEKNIIKKEIIENEKDGNYQKITKTERVENPPLETKPSEAEKLTKEGTAEKRQELAEKHVIFGERARWSFDTNSPRSGMNKIAFIFSIISLIATYFSYDKSVEEMAKSPIWGDLLLLFLGGVISTLLTSMAILNRISTSYLFHVLIAGRFLSFLFKYFFVTKIPFLSHIPRVNIESMDQGANL